MVAPLDSDWQIVGSVRNPWGQIPLTGGGAWLPGMAREYMDRLMAQGDRADPPSKRHHYVPQAYLRLWSFDDRRVWTLDTVSGSLRPLALKSVCVEENFYRVVGSDGAAHNRVELLFGVVDTEMSRIQRLFANLEDPETLTFDDLLGLGVSMAAQRMRTAQQRRIQTQYNRWMVAQDPESFKSFEDNEENPFQSAGFHTESLFRVLWGAADVMTTRQIEVWDDPAGRFMTSDAPVFVPFNRSRRPDLHSAPYIIWPVSPSRAVALSNDLKGEKAVIVPTSGKMLGILREGIEQGRERMIFFTEDQKDRAPVRKRFTRRAQSRLRCSKRTPDGAVVPGEGCCVQWSEGFGSTPDVAVCDLHVPAPTMFELS